MHRAGKWTDWFGSFWVWYLLVRMPTSYDSRTFSVASHGVLAATTDNRTIRHLPLAAVEAKRQKRRWRLRWREGRLRPEVVLPDAPGLAELFETTAGREGPLTEKDAAKLVTVVAHHRWYDWRLWSILGCTLVGFGAAVLLGQPLFLLSLLGMPAAVAVFRGRHLVLTPDAFWIAEDDNEPICIDRSTLRVDRSKSRPRLLTPHPAYPVILMSRFTGDYLMNRIEYGDQPLSAEQTSLGTQPQARCSLCGRPMEAIAAMGEVLICGQCQARARLEAMDAGHGLGGRDSKPM